jgi:type III pantothenate kinase
MVSHKTKLPIKIIYDDPSSVGADRIANAVAAYAEFGGPVIVVDFGTATTFDIVNERGEYVGGVIAPGPVTAGSDLAKKAARLFEVRIEKPDRVIGQNTGGAIKSGLFFGTIGQVEYIIQLISKEMKLTPRVIATGGLANSLEKYCPSVESVNTTLTLDGLKLIADFQDE